MVTDILGSHLPHLFSLLHEPLLFLDLSTVPDVIISWDLSQLILFLVNHNYLSVCNLKSNEILALFYTTFGGTSHIHNMSKLAWIFRPLLMQYMLYCLRDIISF